MLVCGHKLSQKRILNPVSLTTTSKCIFNNNNGFCIQFLRPFKPYFLKQHRRWVPIIPQARGENKSAEQHKCPKSEP